MTESVPASPETKPAANWDRIHLRYISGIEERETIAREEGVSVAAIDKTAQRKGWTRQRKAVLIRTETVTTRAAQQAANSVKPALQAHLKDIADSRVMRKQVSTMREADRKASVLLKVTQAAKLVEGWQDTSERIINLEILSDHCPESTGPPEPTAIDVPTVPPDPPVSVP